MEENFGPDFITVTDEEGNDFELPRKKKRGITVGRVIGIFFKVLGTLILIGLCTGALLACFATVYINEVIVPKAKLYLDDFPLGENSIMYYQDKNTGQYVEMTTLRYYTRFSLFVHP